MIKAIESLQFQEVREKITHYCGMPSSPAEILNEEIVFNPLLIERKNRMSEEALNILKKGKDISFDGIPDVRDALERSLKDIVLTPFELQQCLAFHQHTRRIAALLRSIDGLDELRDYVDALMLDEKTYREIDAIVDQNAQIKRTASKRLEQLFRRSEEVSAALAEKAKRFTREHASSLQETSSFTRNDRVTFLIKNSDKNKYDGYKFGESASGQAAYVEPAEFVELNNRRLSSQEEIQAEIARILREASRRISSSAALYLNDYESLTALDVIFAKAHFGQDYQGTIGKLTREGELFLKDICHPLIPYKQVVSNTYRFRKEYNGIVISGSNTGGKTVSLKVIGLAVLMTYTGIPLIASEAFVPLYDRLFVDIEDASSIESSLSTFSSHLRNIDVILKEATSSSLVLIDELATGTDPKEAEALSLAILDRFSERHIPFILTTHYDEIKKYAYEDPRILLSAVGFDNEKLQPTYKYSENVIGESNALAIAHRYIDDEELLQETERYLKAHRSEEETLLEELREKIKEQERLQEELQREKEAAQKKQQQLEAEKHRFAKEKKKLESSYREELDAYLEEKKEEAEKILAELKRSAQTPSRPKKAVSRLEELNTLEPTESSTDSSPLQAGDRVRIHGSEGVGILMSLEKNRARVALNGMEINVKIRDLQKLPPLPKKPTVRTSVKRKSVPSEINLIGMRVDEALPLLSKYLDDAFASGRSGAKIIHGLGTLALRNASRDLCKKTSFIKSFKDGDYYDGGGAVTIVEFKNGTEG